MKRSEINKLQQEAVDFFDEQYFLLPSWAYWSKEVWLNNIDKASEIIENKLGWDLTDFGLGDFANVGMAGIFWVNDAENGYFAHGISRCA